MFIRGEFHLLAELNTLDMLSCIYASVIHDFKHPGYNNGFLINSKSPIAFQYNGMFIFICIDKSVLENYHVAEAFKLLKNESLNIFEKLETADFKHLRKRTIEAVLSTDMMNHSKLVGIITSRLFLQIKESEKPLSLSQVLEGKKELNLFEIQQDYINFIIHSIDIGHAAKPFKLEYKWAELVTKEFHNQGDIEKSLGLPISFLCDRATANLPASQIGFISGIVLPTFHLVEKFLPKIGIYVDYIVKSKEEWEKLKEEKEIMKQIDNKSEKSN